MFRRKDRGSTHMCLKNQARQKGLGVNGGIVKDPRGRGRNGK